MSIRQQIETRRDQVNMKDQMHFLLLTDEDKEREREREILEVVTFKLVLDD
jgi:hypothetical protein